MILQRGRFLGALITPLLSVFGSLFNGACRDPRSAPIDPRRSIGADRDRRYRRSILVDPRALEQLKDKESFEHEKLLEKKDSRPAEKKVTSASNF